MICSWHILPAISAMLAILLCRSLRFSFQEKVILFFVGVAGCCASYDHLHRELQQSHDSPGNIHREIIQFWEQECAAIESFSHRILHDISENPGNLHAVQQRIDHEFSGLLQSMNKQILLPPAGVRLINDEGGILAGAGSPFETIENWNRLVGSGTEALALVTLPAGTEAVFIYRSNGVACLTDLPLTHTAITGIINPRRSVISFLESAFPVHAVNLNIDSGNSDPETTHSLPITPEFSITYAITRSGSVNNPTAVPLLGTIAWISIMIAVLGLSVLIVGSVSSERIGVRFLYAALGSAFFYTFFSLTIEGNPLTCDALTDPQIFAHSGWLPHSSGELILLALSLWMIALNCHFHIPDTRNPGIFRITSALLLGMVPLCSVHIVDGLVSNSSLEWWPYLMIPHKPASILLPVSLLLIMGAYLRIVIWSCGMSANLITWKSILTYFFLMPAFTVYMSLFSGIAMNWYHWAFLLVLPAAHWIRNRQQGTRTNQYLLSFSTMIITVLVTGPELITRSFIEGQNNVKSSLMNWIENRDELRVFAVESNLRLLADDPDIKRYLSSPEYAMDEYFAFNIWKKCDLSAISSKYGVEIRDAEDQLIDRFAPNLYPESLPSHFFNRLHQLRSEPLLLPLNTMGATFQSDLSGAIAIHSGNTYLGCVILQLPIGPLTALPGTDEWGRTVRLFSGQGDKASSLPQNLSPLPDPGNLNGPDNEPIWMDDPVFHRAVLWLPVPDSESHHQAPLLAILPHLHWTAQISGLIQLLMISLGIVIPEIIISQLQIFIRNRQWTRGISFRSQLLMFLMITAIVVPLIFTGILHHLLREFSRNQRHSAVLNLTETSRNRLIDRAIEYARNLQSIIIQTESGEDPMIPRALMDMPWVILDNHGEVVQSSSSRYGPISPTLLASGYQTSQPQTGFYTNPDGFIAVQIFLPFPETISLRRVGQLTGTFYTEIPITGKLIQSIQESSDVSIDIYSNDRISASSRADLFNTGFLPAWLILDDNKIRQQSDNTWVQTSPISPDRDIGYTSICDDSGSTIGMMAVERPRIADFESETSVFDVLLMISSGLFIIGLWVSVTLGKRLASPIRALVDGSIRVASGDLETPVNFVSGGELGHLINTFNRMLGDLAAQRQDLELRHLMIATLLETMSSGIITVDDHNRIIIANRAARNLIPMNTTTRINQDLREMFRELNLQPIWETLEQFRSGNSSGEVTVRFLWQGTIVHLQAAMVRLPEGRHDSGSIMIVMDDISATVRASKMEAYTALARRIAHEIKNPLTPIQLSVEHLRQVFSDHAPEFPAVFDRCTTMILEETQSLKQLASEFSRFARFPKPSFIIADFRELIQEVLLLFSAPPDHIKLTHHVSQEPLWCRFDQDQMKRVLINLIQNGIHAMPEGGTLTVIAKRDGRFIMISVKDTGIGMSPETILHLFEPYFSTKSEGIGLGLVISKSTIEAHDGEIKVWSHPGQGSIFTVLLPFYENGYGEEKQTAGL